MNIKFTIYCQNLKVLDIHLNFLWFIQNRIIFVCSGCIKEIHSAKYFKKQYLYWMEKALIITKFLFLVTQTLEITLQFTRFLQPQFLINHTSSSVQANHQIAIIFINEHFHRASSINSVCWTTCFISRIYKSNSTADQHCYCLPQWACPSTCFPNLIHCQPLPVIVSLATL